MSTKRPGRGLKLLLGIGGVCVLPGAAYGLHLIGDAPAANVTVAARMGAGIQPGAQRAVSFTATNPTDAPVLIHAVHLAAVGVDAGHAACDTRDFAMDDVPQDYEVTAGTAAQRLPAEGSLTFANTAVNQDACQGATLTLAAVALPPHVSEPGGPG